MRWMLLLAIGCSMRPEQPLADADPAATDADGDGYTLEQDCDDHDPDIHPSADETCDGIDQDCDGEIDEDAIDVRTFYLDADGDGVGSDAASIEACEPLDGFVRTAYDCDDDDDRVYPGATEICLDGVDNDCVNGVQGCELTGVVSSDTPLTHFGPWTHQCAYDDVIGSSHVDAVCPFWRGRVSSGPLPNLGGVIIPTELDLILGSWGDVDGDGHTDLIYLYGEVVWGPITAFAPAASPSLERPTLATLDANGDGAHDVIIDDDGWAQVRLGGQPRDEPFGEGRRAFTREGLAVRAIRDIIGDDGDDLLFSMGTGLETRTWVTAVGAEPVDPLESGVEVGLEMSVIDDVTSDGQPDAMLRIDGQTALVQGPLRAGEEPISVATFDDVYAVWASAGDVDGDGTNDLVLISSTRAFHVFLGPVSGAYSASDADLVFAGASFPARAAMVFDDFDNDGRLDLIVPVEGPHSEQGSVQALLYYGDGR